MYVKIPTNFENLMTLLEFNLGYFHPIQLQISELIVQYYQTITQFEPALQLYAKSLVILQRCLGANPERQAILYLQMAEIQKRHGARNEDIVPHLEKAFFIYQSQRGNDSPKLAEVAEKLAEANLALQRVKDVVQYANLALRIYFETSEVTYLPQIGHLLDTKIKLTLAVGDYKNALVQSDRFYLLLDRHSSMNVQLFEMLIKQYLLIYARTMNQNLRVFIKDVFESKCDRLKLKYPQSYLHLFGSSDLHLQTAALVYLKELINRKGKKPIVLVEQTFLGVAEMSIQSSSSFQYTQYLNS